MRRVHKTSESKITRPARVAILLAATTLVAAGTANAATFTWNGGSTGPGDNNLTTDANWVGGTAPAAAGNHDLQFAGSTRLSPVIPNSDPTWAVNSITFNSGAGTFTVGTTPAAGIFNIGTGGVTVSSTNAQTITANLGLSADQTWNVTSGNLNVGATNNARSLDLNNRTLTWSVASGRTLVQRHSIASTGGTGTINVNGAASTSLFNMNGTPSSAVNFVLNGGDFRLLESQGFGSGTIDYANTAASIALNPTNNNVNWTGANAIQATLNLSAATGTYSIGQPDTTGTTTLQWAGNWSGTFASGQTNRIGTRLGANSAELWLSGNNSGLTAAVAKDVNTDAVYFMRRGRLILDSPNALGVGNSLTIGVSDGNSTGQARVLATNGNNVSGNILMGYRPGIAQADGNVFVGLQGSGAVEFSGKIRLNPQNDTTANTRNALLVGGLGTATFSGTIEDANTTGRNYTVTVSTGTVILTGNNTYKGGTTVSQTGGGTTLLVNNTTGSGTGTGPVQVNADNALGGIGFIAGAVNVDGILRPGTPAVSGGVGTLTFLDNLTVIGRYDAQVNASTSDLLALTGVTNNTLTLGAASSLDVLGTLNPAVDYTLATYGARTGTFNSVLLNGVAQPTPTAFGGVGGTHTLVYNTSALQLVAIPEPSALGLLGFAGLAMLRRRRGGNA